MRDGAVYRLFLFQDQIVRFGLMQHFNDLLPVFHLKLRLIAVNGDISVMRMLSVYLHSPSLIYSMFV